MVIGELTLPVTGLVALQSDGGVCFVCDATDPERMRQKIAEIGQCLLIATGKYCDLPVTHELSDGMYIRRMLIPKGTLIVGKVHKRPCINVVESGDIAVLTESGAMRVKAGFMSVTPAGLQKLGYANEDTVFTNIFSVAGDHSDDLEALERELVCDSHAEYVEHIASINSNVIEIDEED